MNIKDVEQKWTAAASKLLLGRKIVKVRYLTLEEQGLMDWYERCVVIQLDNGVLLFPSRDDEGNDAGALFTTDDDLPTIPVL